MIRQFKFLADENVHHAVISYLQSQSIDTVDVYSLQLNGKSDREIIEQATKFNRVVFTHDADFGQIIFTEKLSFKGLVYLQPGHIRPEVTIQTLNVLLSVEQEIVEPFIIVADNNTGNVKIRIRNAVRF